jgi:hypothetical protein
MTGPWVGTLTRSTKLGSDWETVMYFNQHTWVRMQQTERIGTLRDTYTERERAGGEGREEGRERVR